MIKRLTLMGLLLTLSVNTLSADQIRLYKQYIIGTPKAYLEKIHVLEDCAERYEQGTLCMQNHTLSGEPSEIAFRFLTDRLVSVVLMMPLGDVSKIKKMFHVMKTQFDLVLIENGKERLDIIELSGNTFAKNDFTQLIADFENEAYKNHSIKYTFISKDEFISQSRKASNFAEIFKGAPIHIRAATYSVGRKDNQVIGTITFIVPGITQEYLDQNPIVEDF